MKKIISSTLALSVLMSGVSAIESQNITQAATSKTTYKLVEKKSILKYKTIKKTDPNLEEGKTRVTKGKNGYVIKVYKQKIQKGKVISSKYVKTKKTVKAKSKVIYVGTKKVVVPVDSKPSAPVEKYELNKVRETIEYQTIYQNDPSLLKGKQVVVQEGEDGIRENAFNERYIDGKLISTTPAYKKIIIEPVNKIVRVGTKEEKINNTGIDPKYQDGRFNVDTLDTDMGYAVGKTTYQGDKVNDVEFGVKSNMLDIAKESDEDKFNKANDYNYDNKVWLNADNLVVGISANYRTIQGFNNNEFFSNQKFNDEMIRLINIDRKAKGLNPLEYRAFLQPGSDIRAGELVKNKSITVNDKPHVRLNGESYITAFSEDIRKNVCGENTLGDYFYGNPYELVSEKYLANKFFERWKKSPGHYAQMMAPDFKGVATSVKLGQGTEYFSFMVGNQNFSKN